MKFLCIPCDEQMSFDERQQPGDGTFGAAFSCPKCGYRVAMLANPMETQLVESLGVKIGGRVLDGAPMELVRERMVGRDDAFRDDEPTRDRPRWSPESEARLARVPKFVRGMVKRVYGDWAAERGIMVITPEIMDEARVDLGLEHM
jgi:Proto-chlorophyllide reductase 57 kD subunit